MLGTLKNASMADVYCFSTPVAYILEKLRDCCFFDDEVQPSMLFLTLHDAMLHILEKHPDSTEKKSHNDRVKGTVLTSETWHYITV